MPNGDIDGVDRFVFYYVVAVLLAPGCYCLKSLVGVVWPCPLWGAYPVVISMVWIDLCVMVFLLYCECPMVINRNL